MSKHVPTPILPMQDSFGPPSLLQAVFESHGERHAADDADLRQFIMHQFSMQTSHVQCLLQGLEHRVVDALRAVAAESGLHFGSGSPLKHGAMTETVPPAPSPEHLPGTLNSDHSSAPQLGNGTVHSPKRAFAPQDCLASSLGEEISHERNNSERSAQTESEAEKDEGSEGRPRKFSKIEDEMKQVMPFASLKSESEDDPRSTSDMTIHERCTNFMNSRPSELVISFLILLNAMVIGVQVDSQMRNPAENVERSLVFNILGLFFTSVFSLELFLRLFVEKITFFFSIRNANFHWNLFDFCLVASSILEHALNAMMDSTPDVSMLRVFRIVRLVRLFRIVRVMRFFQNLRIMVSGIAQSMQSLVWALLLMLCVMYLVAVCVLQFAVEEGVKRARDSSSGDLSDDEYTALKQYFGSLGSTLYTLYLSITGGLDWGQAAEPLFAVGWTLGCFFLAYTAFSVLCVLNIVTGVFVENCNKMTAKDDELVYMEQFEQRKLWYEEVKEMFQTADADNSGFLDAKEFSDKVSGDARLRAWMRKIGVHVEAYSAGGLFKLMDLDGDGLLGLDEFCAALQQVQGQARSIDVAKVLHDTKMLRRLLIALIERLAPECFLNRKALRSQTSTLDAFSAEMQTQSDDALESETPSSTGSTIDLTQLSKHF